MLSNQESYLAEYIKLKTELLIEDIENIVFSEEDKTDQFDICDDILLEARDLQHDMVMRLKESI